ALDLWLHRKLNARVDFEIMNSYSGFNQMAQDQRHETSFLGDDMLRNAGVGEEVECPGNTPLTGPSTGDTRTPAVPDLAAAYAITGETEDPNSVGIAVDQRLTRQQALDDKTLQCAWQMLQDGRLGQLTPGAHADLIVLDQDYFTVPNHSIRDIRALLTLVNG